MSAPEIAVDLTQFFRMPAASGIQRVVWGLAQHWPADLAAGRFFFAGGAGRHYVITARDTAQIISSVFENRQSEAHWPQMVQQQGKKAAGEAVTRKELIASSDAWLLPELTYDTRILRAFDIASSQIPAALLFHDAIPETSPESFTLAGLGVISRYFRRAALAPLVISNSVHSDTVLHDRLRRDRSLPAFVASPGADHVPARHSDAPAIPTFAIIGTLEPRKRHDLVIEGFLKAHAQNPGIHLMIAGRRHGSARQLNEWVDREREAGLPITWIEAPSDDEVATIYRLATAVLSVGEEGYGLPVLEAMRGGCPVAFAGVQPAAEICEGSGATRLAAQSADAICDFMLAAAEPERARELRAEIGLDTIPSWDGFARGVVGPLVTAAASFIPAADTGLTTGAARR